MLTLLQSDTSGVVVPAQPRIVLDQTKHISIRREFLDWNTLFSFLLIFPIVLVQLAWLILNNGSFHQLYISFLSNSEVLDRELTLRPEIEKTKTSRQSLVRSDELPTMSPLLLLISDFLSFFIFTINNCKV